MPIRWLVGFPLVWGGAFLVLDVLFTGTAAYGTFMRTAIELSKILAVVGALGAALAHERGEYMRRAWLFIAGGTACFLARDLTLAPFGFEAMGETPLLVLRGLLVVAGNVCSVVGIFLLARTWRVAELTLPVQPKGRWGVRLAAVFLALVLAGPSAVSNGTQLLQGDLTVVAGVASSLGDMISLFLIAPLLLTVLALHGGVFMWPWALITAASVGWLFYDGFAVYGPALGLSAEASRTGYELFRALACGFTFTAGLAQRWIARKTS